MRNIWRLFVDDIKRIRSNAITAIVILGLVLLPSLFSWYNIIACWDVFSNTDQLSVAVANSDEGYESSLVHVNMNIGEKVLSALRENDQVNWVFTDEEDAIDGTKSGKYYAAVVIPENFSRDMLSFDKDSDSDESSAQIVYYVNDKSNAISPRITDQVADTVSTQVNKTFTETIANIALSIASSFADYADDSNLSDSIASLASRLKENATTLSKTADTVNSYAEIVVSAESIVDDSSKLLNEASDSLSEVADSAKDAKQSADNITTAFEDSSEKLSEALQKSIEAYKALPDAVDSAFDSADTLSKDAANSLRNRADTADALASDFHTVASQLSALEDSLPDDVAEQVESIVKKLENAASTQESLRDALRKSADEIDSQRSSSDETREEVNKLLNQASEDIEAAQKEYDTNLKPALTELSSTLESATSSISDLASKLKGVGGTSSTSAIDDTLNDAQDTLSSAASSLDDAASKIDELGTEIQTALAEGDSATLRKLLDADSSALAAALSSPVSANRIAIYPVDNFGSAMSPLYTTLALWIGCLLMMVTLKMQPGDRSEAGVRNPTQRQIFLGHFGIVALLSLAQSTLMGLGNLIFLEVQANNPLLYMLCFWVTGLTFGLIIYTLVFTFANLGKAMSVILLILQVSSGGGSYPLALLPELIQNLSPFLPITHAINAMRAAMFGVYQGDFWIELLTTVSFAIPLVLLALIFIKPVHKIVTLFLKRAEASKLM